jgi:Protein of unknown function (DUF2637)
VARKSDDRQGSQGANASLDPGQSADGRAQAHAPAPGSRPGKDTGRVLRILALIAVAVGLTGLTAAACVLSYSSIHELAVQAGVHGRLASVYPYIFDAMLVIAGCSVLALRTAGLVSRIYSWLCMLVLLAALAGGGAIRAAAVTVPHKVAGVVAAIVPWALVLIGFGLLLALLRYARLRLLGRRNGDHGAANGPAAKRQAANPSTRAPTALSPPVSERDREREPAAQRALSPGMPQRAVAVPAPVPLAKEATRTQAGLEAAEAKPKENGTRDAREPAQASPAAGGSSTPATAASRGTQVTGTEPPTAPGASVPAPPAPRAETTQTADRASDRAAQPAGAAPQPAGAAPQPAGAAHQPAARQPAASEAAAPEAAAAETMVQARPKVRPAEMQLRARIPKQPAQDAGAGPAQPGWPQPFMPHVGQQGGHPQPAGSPEPDRPPVGEPSGAGEPAVAPQPGDQETGSAAAKQVPDAGVLPKRVPGQQPGIAGGGERAPAERPAGPHDATVRLHRPDAAPADQQPIASPADQQPTAPPVDRQPTPAAPEADQQSAAGSLNPAPTHATEDDKPHGLPAFRRARSSPEPPQGDDRQDDQDQG